MSAALDTGPAGTGQRNAALALCLAAAAVALALLPLAARPGPPMPGFMLVHQTALVLAHGLAAGLLFSQFRQGRRLALALAGACQLYTTAIVALQLLSVPNGLAPGRLLGSGPETTIWLWTFWHMGPPVCALLYAAVARRGGEVAAGWGWAAAAAALAAAAMSGALATWGLPWLPHQVSGDDYSAMVESGVGPAVQALTVLALGVLWWRTRAGGRSVLEVWLLAGLALMVLDNLLTLAGGARATVGWQAGRVLALGAGLGVVWAFVAETEAMRRREAAATAEARRHEAALREAQKMEAVGRLTGGIAHDFNNMLMVVQAGFETIRRRPADAARVAAAAEAGLEAVDRAARLTRQLLTYARRRELRAELVQPNAVLLALEPLLRRALGERGRLELRLDPALPPARLDVSEFEQAMLNLLVNARDALRPEGGVVAVETSGAGGSVEVRVRDDGHGMAEAVRQRAAEPFFTTKEFGRGSGLGLAQVYGFAQGAGGEMALESAPGAGTAVTLRLPAAAGEAAPRAAHGPAGALRPARGDEVVLAVEDEPAVLAAAVESLSDLGYRVEAARDAAEALALLDRGARVDVLFSDVVMPGGMNGVQLAVEARRRRPGLRVVLTSGYTNEALAGEHRVPPDVPVLPKPWRREELARLLAA
ncbi:MASE4 domain-containing protein [Roseococcus sp. DSY-14]|uniref:MASE4 domain-containing protein n=1 Tax=Roseococcus sp. DSY-14 TaxID=3369650 RepID=UPI00387B5DFF